MGRKKKEKLPLEREFSKFVNLHKFAIISSALVQFEDEGIYNSYLFKGKYDDYATTGVAKAREVANTLLRDSFKSGEANILFNKCYNYCWKKYKPYLDDDFNATKNMIDD